MSNYCIKDLNTKVSFYKIGATTNYNNYGQQSTEAIFINSSWCLLERGKNVSGAKYSNNNGVNSLSNITHKLIIHVSNLIEQSNLKYAYFNNKYHEIISFQYVDIDYISIEVKLKDEGVN